MWKCQSDKQSDACLGTRCINIRTVTLVDAISFLMESRNPITNVILFSIVFHSVIIVAVFRPKLHGGIRFDDRKSMPSGKAACNWSDSLNTFECEDSLMSSINSYTQFIGFSWIFPRKITRLLGLYVQQIFHFLYQCTFFTWNMVATFFPFYQCRCHTRFPGALATT